MRSKHITSCLPIVPFPASHQAQAARERRRVLGLKVDVRKAAARPRRQPKLQLQPLGGRKLDGGDGAKRREAALDVARRDVGRQAADEEAHLRCCVWGLLLRDYVLSCQERGAAASSAQTGGSSSGG